MKKRLISLLLVFAMVLTMLPVTALAAPVDRDTSANLANPFTDVKETDWFYDAVQYARINGFFSGTSKTTFDPNGTMTRGMFVTVLGRMAGVDTEAYEGQPAFSDVPERMYYEEGPVIDLQPGYQLLNGEQCMWLCRYRSSYVNGDIDRIDVQHDFLKAAAEQFLSLGSIPNVSKLASLLAENMDTNMTAANMAYFARQLLMCDSEDINFHTAPNTPRTVHELSYTFLDLYDWLELVNTVLNPYSEPVTEGQLDLVYLHGGNVCCTTAINGMAYFTESRRESSPEPAEEEYVPEEEEYPEPEEEPGDDEGWWLWPELMEQPEEDLNIPTDDDWLIFE